MGKEIDRGMETELLSWVLDLKEENHSPEEISKIYKDMEKLHTAVEAKLLIMRIVFFEVLKEEIGKEMAAKSTEEMMGYLK